MSSPSSRLLDLLSLLQSRPRWSATELAGRMQVTERTVRRDVTRLRDLGYPVNAEPGPAGGYQLGAGRALPPLLLSDDEAVAVAIGLRATSMGAMTGHEEAAVAALAKLEQVLPAHVRERIIALTTSTVLLGGGPPIEVSPDALLTLAQASRRSERVRFTYRTGAGVESERRVEPYGLVSADARWYLVGRDLDRQDWRTFRLDRASDIAMTGHRFAREHDPDIAAMVAEGVALATYAFTAEVLLDATPEEARAHIPNVVGTIDATPDGTLLRLGANDLPWIAHYLAGLPFASRVLQPAALRAEIRRVARRLIDSNRTTGPRSGQAVPRRLS